MEVETEEPQRRSGAAASAPAMSCRPTTCPSWLQAAIADIEQRVRALAVSAPETEHSFAERAENYYQKRPQLLALLTDLHHRYLYLADRYSQSLKSLHTGLTTASDCCSFQQPINSSEEVADDASLMVAELVLAWVDRDLLADEAERRRAEAARKIELQGSLVEVLESERLVLLGENARLGSRAAEMARLVVKLREDHRVCMLGRKIEALQAQVYGLELRNRECYETMAAWEAERKVGAAELERLRRKKKKKKTEGWWWSRVRLAAEWTPCTPSAVTVRKVGQQIKGNDAKYYGGCFCI